MPQKHTKIFFRVFLLAFLVFKWNKWKSFFLRLEKKGGKRNKIKFKLKLLLIRIQNIIKKLLYVSEMFEKVFRTISDMWNDFFEVVSYERLSFGAKLAKFVYAPMQLMTFTRKTTFQPWLLFLSFDFVKNTLKINSKYFIYKKNLQKSF